MWCECPACLLTCCLMLACSGGWRRQAEQGPEPGHAVCKVLCGLVSWMHGLSLSVSPQGLAGLVAYMFRPVDSGIWGTAAFQATTGALQGLLMHWNALRYTAAPAEAHSLLCAGPCGLWGLCLWAERRQEWHRSLWSTARGDAGILGRRARPGLGSCRRGCCAAWPSRRAGPHGHRLLWQRG